MVKNPPASAGDIKTWVPSLGREDPLEEGMATSPVFLPGESHGQREPGATVHRVTESDKTEATQYTCKKGKGKMPAMILCLGFLL